MYVYIWIITRRPSNLKELELIAKDEWGKIPVETCKKLVSNYSKRCHFLFKCKEKIFSTMMPLVHHLIIF